MNIKQFKTVAPKVYMTNEVSNWIKEMVDIHNIEVGFYGLVEEEVVNDETSYIITKIFYPKHDLATGTTCEISAEGLQDIMMDMVENGRDEDVGKLKMWGHSHVNMAAGPSGQDESMAKELAEDNEDYLIRLITNKRGDFHITFFDYKNNMIYEDIGIEAIMEPEYYKERILEISEIANSNSGDFEKQFKDIIDVITRQDNTEDIRKEIERLKEINIPKPTYNSYLDRFGRKNKNKNKKKKKVKEYKNPWDLWDEENDDWNNERFML